MSLEGCRSFAPDRRMANGAALVQPDMIDRDRRMFGRAAADERAPFAQHGLSKLARQPASIQPERALAVCTRRSVSARTARSVPNMALVGIDRAGRQPG